MDATGLRPDIDAGFETLFKAHFKGLHAYAITIIKDEAFQHSGIRSLEFT